MSCWVSKPLFFIERSLNSVTNYEANTARNEINVGFVSFSVCGELWFHEGDRWRVTLTDASVCLYVQIEMGVCAPFLCICVFVCMFLIVRLCVCVRCVYWESVCVLGFLLEYTRVLTHLCVYLSKKVWTLCTGPSGICMYLHLGRFTPSSHMLRVPRTSLTHSTCMETWQQAILSWMLIWCVLPVRVYKTIVCS